MDDIAISASGLAKKYQIGVRRDPYGRLSESLWDIFASPFRRSRDRKQASDFWALRDISFEVQRGSAVGVIGRNGAGKSTLLKILSRITEPTSGRAELRGRVGSLLEVGTGFHSELTGRENVFLSGVILGMRRAEIDRRFEEIVEFSGVAPFIDTPVKRYSSGMKVRLGFAVAAFLEPEILLIDEVLAVGDAEFQRRCLGRMEDVAREGRTVMFVSHDLGAVANLTTSCIYLDLGRIKEHGPTPEIIRGYQAAGSAARRDPERGVSYFRRSADPDSPVRIVAVRSGAGDGEARAFEFGTPIESGTPIAIELTVEAYRQIDGVTITATVKDVRGQRIAVLYSPDAGFLLTCPPGRATVALRVEDLRLAPGTYYVDLGLNQSPASVAFDVLLDVPLLEVENNGQVVQWLERPWGAIHPTAIAWRRAE